MGGGSLTRPFSKQAFFMATSKLPDAWELQSPPLLPQPGPKTAGGRPIPPKRDYKIQRAMRDGQGQLPGFPQESTWEM